MVISGNAAETLKTERKDTITVSVKPGEVLDDEPVFTVVEEMPTFPGGDPKLDKEALRVVSAMPDWNPGKQHGKAVAVRYTVPITFRLHQKEDSE